MGCRVGYVCAGMDRGRGGRRGCGGLGRKDMGGTGEKGGHTGVGGWTEGDGAGSRLKTAQRGDFKRKGKHRRLYYTNSRSPASGGLYVILI